MRIPYNSAVMIWKAPGTPARKVDTMDDNDGRSPFFVESSLLALIAFRRSTIERDELPCAWSVIVKAVVVVTMKRGVEMHVFSLLLAAMVVVDFLLLAPPRTTSLSEKKYPRLENSIYSNKVMHDPSMACALAGRDILPTAFFLFLVAVQQHHC